MKTSPSYPRSQAIHWSCEGPQGFTTFRIQGLAVGIDVMLKGGNIKRYVPMCLYIIYYILYNIYIYIYVIHTYMYIYIYTYIYHIWIYNNIHICVCVCLLDEYGSQLTIVVDSTVWTPVNFAVRRLDMVAIVRISTWMFWLQIIIWNLWTKKLASIFAQIKESKKSTSVLIP